MVPDETNNDAGADMAPKTAGGDEAGVKEAAEIPATATATQQPQQDEPAQQAQSGGGDGSRDTGTAPASEHPMKRIYLEKVVLNMGMGRSGDAINVAKKALEQITNGCKPCQRNARDSQRDWGVRKGEPIGAAVTVRGQEAKDLLMRLHEAKGNMIRGRSFDNFGNYSFGIGEHIDIPGVKYEPQIGILGLGVSVALARPGYSIRKRSKHRASVGRSHAITSSEARRYVASEFKVQVTG